MRKVFLRPGCRKSSGNLVLLMDARDASQSDQCWTRGSRRGLRRPERWWKFGRVGLARQRKQTVACLARF